MAPRPGKKADFKRHPAGLLPGLGRAAGFAALAGVALSILAGVVLLPAYASLAEAKYERDCLTASAAEAEDLIRANDRLIAEMPGDAVVTMRVARSQFNLLPENEVVVIDPARRRMPVGPLVTIPQRRRPGRPGGWVIRLAGRLRELRLRRGLLLMAGAAMLAAMFLFATPKPDEGEA